MCKFIQVNDAAGAISKPIRSDTPDDGVPPVPAPPEPRIPMTLLADFGGFGSLLDAVDLVERVRTHDLAMARQPSFDFINETFSQRRRGGLPASDDADDGDLLLGGSKIGRKRIDPGSVQVLTELFESGTHFPSRDQRERLATRLGLSARTIQIWFQNKRQAFKNKRLAEMQTLLNPLGRSRAHEPADAEATPPRGGLLTRLRLDGLGQQPGAPRPALRVPARVLLARRAGPPATARAETLFGRKLSIPELTREAVVAVLPRPPSLSHRSTMVQSLTNKLPELRAVGPAAVPLRTRSLDGTELPSIGLALRRYSVC